MTTPVRRYSASDRLDGRHSRNAREAAAADGVGVLLPRGRRERSGSPAEELPRRVPKGPFRPGLANGSQTEALRRFRF